MEQEMKKVCLTTKVSVQFTIKEFARVPKDREDDIEDIKAYFETDMAEMLRENIRNVEITGMTIDPVLEVLE